MTTKMPEKTRLVTMPRARRTAMMGAAATALIAATPSLHAGEPVMQATTLRAAVKNVLSVPMSAAAKHSAIDSLKLPPAVAAAIVVDNADDITVGVGETAIGRASDSEDVSLINTGDLTGGIGIDVATGAIDLDAALFDETATSVELANYVPLYDDAGNIVYGPYGPQYVPTAELSVNRRTTILARDPLDSRITVDNRGSIAFAGRHGIRTANPAGESIDIVNSGDITSTADTASRSGIYASTESYRNTYGDPVQTVEGEFTYNAYGQLTGVTAPDEYTIDNHLVDMEYDGGAITIHNTGNIDMGAVELPADPYGPRVLLSAGIYTRGDGGTTIVNDGDIKVDKRSSGIHVLSTATTSVSNSGRIDIGNGSSGISFGTSAMGDAGDYRLGGDVYILNTGDIVGGTTRSDAAPGEEVYADGISIFSLGSNNEFLALQAEYNRRFAEYNEILGSEVYPLFDIPKTRLYDTTAVNRGRIELKDGGRGIFITPRAGDSTAINEGTIIVGDGDSIPEANFARPSAGIFQVNVSVQGFGSTTSINAASGVIVTGNDSAGIVNYNGGGDSIAINEGSITTGDGANTRITDYTGAAFDKPFLTHGMRSISAAAAMGTTSYARNSGDITVGELAIGSFVSGQGMRLLNPAEATAINVNEGIITTGDNSSGMFAVGNNVTTFNSGSVTTGSYDISTFQPHPQYTADEFAYLRFGVASSAAGLSAVINDGAITTGDGKIGAAAFMTQQNYGLAAQVSQGAQGVITTGDDATGILAAGTYAAAVVNEGRVGVGDASVGVDVSAGALLGSFILDRRTSAGGAGGAVGDPITALVKAESVYLANAGIIETGDNSVGVRMDAVMEDVSYEGSVLVLLDDYGYYYQDIAGVVDVVGDAYLNNSGTISVGASSTAVEITGAATNEQGLHIFNTGTIEARQPGAGTALSVNAANSLGSYVVNVGEISGDIVFGAGDDRLMNTQFVDGFGRLVSTGNITMTGSTIDFGGGVNRFDNDRGVITIAGGDNLITGADLVLIEASIDSRNNAVGSTLTIDGNLSGSFTFGTDLASFGTDRLIITGNVADGSAMNVVLNPAEQFSGEAEFAVITIGGQNGSSAPVVAGVTGPFADSLLQAQASFDEATGDVVVSALFGMGHMATAAGSATSMAQNWWLQSVGSFDRRNMYRLGGASDVGPSVWSTAFHEEGTVLPENSLQDVSFDQKLSGLQAGIEWTLELAGGSVSVGPMVSYGNADANLNANLASAKGDALAYGLNANYVFENGLYVDATWHKLAMDVDFRTPGTSSSATGESDADGDGFNVELGYAYKLKSGLTLAPQLQYASVDVDLDDFRSSDGVYAFSGVGGKSSLLRAGVSVFRTFETQNGSVTPLVDLNYLDAMDGESELMSNGVWFGNDTTGSGYGAEFGIAGRYKAWDITGRVGLADMSASDQSLTSNVSVRYRW